MAPAATITSGGATSGALPDALLLPAAIYVVDLVQAGEAAAGRMVGQLAPLLQDSEVAKVLHDARLVGGGGE
jgi:hypothetical protein